MSTPESASLGTNPYQPQPDSGTVGPPVDRWRWLLAGVLGILGGYLTLSAVTDSPIIGTLLRPDSFDLDIAVPWLARAIFALAVTALAFFAAPGPLGRRTLAVVVFVVVVVVLFLLTLGRLSGAVRGTGPALLFVLNPYWVVLAAGALGWLIASAARPVAYLSLLLTLIVMPLNFLFAFGGVASGLSTLVQLVLALVVAVVILFASRHAQESPPIAAPHDRWRWMLAGVIGIVGGYLTLSVVAGPLANVLVMGQDWETTLQLVLRGVFALAVTAFAFFVAPGALGRRVLAVVIFVVITAVLLVYLVGRLSGTLRLGGLPILVITNSYWIVLMAGGLGWLLAAGARGLAYLSLLLTVIVMPLTYIFTMNNVGYGTSSTVQLALSLGIAAVILLVSRPAVPYAPAVAAPTQAPSSSAADLAPTAFVAMEEGAEINEQQAKPTP